ncbi:hypothetical protein AYL99_01968 [Fonsecaea erecta]|uniref:Uncharacterized protein n=1 Tax=Fonsecaea erecta TaxID=1367422 RepID=A0A178ZTH7_9EURO|nr:hypothetical protein AYL99_01968 [Fonsecaea erecta]OAP62741.1 hypothetical protein AYL99_01968 [Fonsecaea erecta]
MSSSTSALGKLPLTFGVEIEHAFGVNQDVVGTDKAYRWLLPGNCTIHPNTPNPPDFDPGREEICGILQAVKILRSKGATLNVITWDNEDEGEDREPTDTDMYSHWNMTEDRSVRYPWTAQQLYELSGGRITMWPGWEFSGLELISPALKVPEFGSGHFLPNGLDQVKGFLDLMNEPQPQGTPYCFLSGPQMAGVHVHIGLQPQPDRQLDLPTEFLRHLAFICLAYEDTITLLHHPQRHGYTRSYSYPHVRSNRFVGRLVPPFPRHRCQKGPEFSLADVFLRLFRARDTNELVELLTTVPSDNSGDYQYMVRECFVNFTNCFDFGSSPMKRTVEFRQHHGTLDAEDIGQWVVFLTALARTAERKANEQPPPAAACTVPTLLLRRILTANIGERVAPGKTDVLDTPADVLWRETISDARIMAPIIREAVKYPQLFHTDTRRSLKELFDLIELPVPYRRYWWERAKRCRAEWAATWRGLIPCLDVEPCALEPVRDNKGWAAGELDVPPWDVDADQSTDTFLRAEPQPQPQLSRPNVMSIEAIMNGSEPVSLPE